MATPAGYLDNLIKDQAARIPEAVNREYWANRFLFVPFHDRALTMELMGSLGLPEFKAGLILPITRFRQVIVDNTAVQRVPVGHDGKFIPVAPGIEDFKLKDRAPSVVMDAILRIFNPQLGVDPAQDNGICEVEALRGNEDFDLLRQIQQTCLPDAHSKARPQLLQIAKAVLGNVPASIRSVEEIEALTQRVEFEQSTSKLPVLMRNVAKRLYQSTVSSFTWARWLYHNLQSQMENQAESGKRRLSPLDAAVCEWIEMPEPRYQSRLASAPQQVVVQAAAAAATPIVWCEDCGATTNLGPEGQKPKRCPVCQTPFDVVPDAPVEVS